MEHKVLARYPIGNKRFVWKQKDYVLSTFSCYPQSEYAQGEPDVVADKSIGNLKEANFNLLELGWVGHEGSWAAVEAAEKHGVDLIFQDLSILGGMQGRFGVEELPGSVIEDLTAKLKPKKHTIGYYVWDEPCSDEMFTEARRQMDLLEENDPEALLFTVALPNYNLAGENQEGFNWENGKYLPYVEEFIKRMDPPVLSFDYYPVGDYFNAWGDHKFNRENQLDDTFMWLDMALHRHLAEKNNLPFWFYYQGYSLYKCTDYFIFPMVRCFMYAGILYGAKALQNYATGELRNKTILMNGEKGEFYEEQKKINTEIKALGNTLMALNSKLVYHSKELLPDCKYIKPYINTIEESEIFCGELPRRISVGELEDGYGNSYAVILNRDYETAVTTALDMKDSFRIYEVSKSDGKQRVIADSTDKLALDLEAGDAVLLRIQKADEEPFTVEYELK